MQSSSKFLPIVLVLCFWSTLSAHDCSVDTRDSVPTVEVDSGSVFVSPGPYARVAISGPDGTWSFQCDDQVNCWSDLYPLGFPPPEEGEESGTFEPQPDETYTVDVNQWDTENGHWHPGETRFTYSIF